MLLYPHINDVHCAGSGSAAINLRPPDAARRNAAVACASACAQTNRLNYVS